MMYLVNTIRCDKNFSDIEVQRVFTDKESQLDFAVEEVIRINPIFGEKDSSKDVVRSFLADYKYYLAFDKNEDKYYTVQITEIG